MIYPGPLGKVLIYSDDSLQLYDISARKVMYEVSCTEVKQVYWSNNFTNAVIITKTCKFTISFVIFLRDHHVKQELRNCEYVEGKLKD